MHALFRRLLALPRRRRLERDLDDELSFHLAMVEQEHQRNGEAPRVAEAAARRRFGSVLQVKEHAKDTWRLGWVERVVQEMGFAVRGLRRSPGLTAAAILTLGLGIGANTAMFMLLNGLLLRPLPVREPDRLVRLAGVDVTGREGYLPLTVVDEMRRQPLFAGVCAFLTPLSTVQSNAGLAAVSTLALSGDCFETLGLRATIGRLFGADDDREGAPGTLVLTYDTWIGEFGGAPDVLGQRVVVDGHALTIIGVAERRFSGLLVGFPARMLYPLAFAPLIDQPLLRNVNVFARLPAGRTTSQVEGRVATIWPQLLNRTVPDTYTGSQRDAYVNRRLAMSSAATGIDYSLRTQFERPLFALLVISTMVLLHATTTVANLLLARLQQRRHEYAVRVALGAGTGRLVTQALAESVILLAPALGVGLVFAHAGASFLVLTYANANATFALDLSPDARTMTFGAAAAMTALCGCMIAPIWRMSRVDPASVLQGMSVRLTGTRAHLRQALVVTQMAVATALLAVAVLFGLTLRELSEVSLGFDPGDVSYARLSPLPGGYDPPFAAESYYRALLDRFAAIPHVRSAALAHAIPLADAPVPDLVAPAERPDATVPGRVFRVTEGFIAALHLPLVAGRDVSRHDPPNGVRTAVLSEGLATRLFGSRNALGRYVRVGVNQRDHPIEVVGVTADATLDDPKSGVTPAVFLNYWQQPASYQQYPNAVLRVDAHAPEVLDALRTEVGRAGHEYTRVVRTLDQARDAALVQQRLLAALAASFGVVGLVLAIVGLAGLLNFLVAGRTRELGIRLALGASPMHTQWLVLRDALVATTVGTIVGLAGVWLSGRAISTLLFGVSPMEGRALAATIATLAVAGGLASWLPARRISRVEPVVALRSE